MQLTKLRRQVLRACRRILSEENRDLYSPAYGSFDRRFWGWKIVDYPEATFQRNALSLAWLIEKPNINHEVKTEVLIEAVHAALQFSACIQHKDGSFDQAFPQEHSFGATGFLLYSLLEALKIVRGLISDSFINDMEKCLQKAANFLCIHDEQHGRITNHIAGAALSLKVSSDYFSDQRFKKKSDYLLERVMATQSNEGWFPEYGGPDPGYQTLCLYYLAKIYQIAPNIRLKTVLDRAIEFLSWFAHPDGTFGGEYGSRRTAIFYPGGLAILARENITAQRLLNFMIDSINTKSTVTIDDIDIGNIAPVLENYITVIDFNQIEQNENDTTLPCYNNFSKANFTSAGLFVRGTTRYYALLGVSNGGVIKIFDKKRKKAIWNDGGYVGNTMKGKFITTQITDLDRTCAISDGDIRFETSFYRFSRTIPTPGTFLLLRLLNLTIMRNKFIGNYIKKLMVNILMTQKRPVSLKLTRTVTFGKKNILINDRITGDLKLRWLEYGRPFVSIHMASARYYEGVAGDKYWVPQRLSTESLNRSNFLELIVKI